MKPAETPRQEFRPAEVSDSGTIRVPKPPAPKPAAPIPTAVNEPRASASAMRVAFKASEPVWVSIKSDGTRAFTGTLEGQQTREFDAAQRMTVLVGNAGSLDISLNGKPMAPSAGRAKSNC